MAKVLKTFEFPSAPKAKHPWGEWLDGQIRQLTADDWGDAKPFTIASLARSQAAKQGKKVRLSIDQDAGTITLQAVPMTEQEKAEAETRRLARESDKQEAEQQEAELDGKAADGEANSDDQPPSKQPKKGNRRK